MKSGLPVKREANTSMAGQGSLLEVYPFATKLRRCRTFRTALVVMYCFIAHFISNIVIAI